MVKKIYRTVICYEILSDEPINIINSLNEISNEVTDGSWSGRFLENKVTDEELEGKFAVNAIKAQGSSPEFFGIDDDEIDY